jgi:hypothetical protein
MKEFLNGDLIVLSDGPKHVELRMCFAGLPLGIPFDVDLEGIAYGLLGEVVPLAKRFQILGEK